MTPLALLRGANSGCLRLSLALSLAWVGGALRLRGQEDDKVIFYYGKWGCPHQGHLQNCSAPCRVTTSAEEMSLANAVIWNDASFAFGHLHAPAVPRTKPAGQRWLFAFYFEPPSYGEVDLFEGVRRKDHAMDSHQLFDWTMTYRPGSDFFWPQSRLIRSAALEASAKTQAASAVEFRRWQARPKLLLALVSNCVRERMGALQRLQRALPPGSLDIYGTCGKADPCGGHGHPECEEQLFSQYKFYAAFESRRFRGYITEKFFRALQHGMVPVVIGGTGREDYEALGVPSQAMLHVDDFSSLENMADYLRFAADTAGGGNLSRAFDWKNDHRVAGTSETRISAFCEVCEELHKPEAEQRPARRFGDNVADWWFNEEPQQYVPA